MNGRKVLKIIGLVILYIGLLIAVFFSYIAAMQSKGDDSYGFFDLRPKVYVQSSIEPYLNTGNILWLKKITPELRQTISEGSVISYNGVVETIPNKFVEERLYTYVTESQNESHIIKVADRENPDSYQTMKITQVEELAVHVWPCPKAMTDYLMTTDSGQFVLNTYMVITGLITIALVVVKIVETSRKSRKKH